MEDKEFPKVNHTQTQVSEKLLKKLDKKSKTDFFNFLYEVEFIKTLTSPDRQRAKDRPRDSKGRIIVDLENLHMLEDMSFFTKRADYYRKNGRYTDIYPNPAPGSEYRKFWDEERRRCKEGYVRESDGEWISGYYYFYLNYSPILKVDEIEGEFIHLDEGVRADRVEDFPDVWDADYLYFHYLEQAQDKGQHANILKTRGSGQSFKFGSQCSRNYFLTPKSKSYAFASETEYLIRDGVLTKAWAIINFVDNNTPFTQPRDYKDTEMHKRASYKDIKNKTERGMLSEIIGVTCKNDPSKGRGKRGQLLAFDESGVFDGLKKVWAVARKSVEQGRYVYGLMVAAGTGGEEGSDFEAAEAFFYQPEAYNIKSIKNVFDITKADSRSSLFIGGYLNRQGCYDENGNSDIIKALVEICYQRQKVRLNSNDPNDLVQEKAETPITPQEAVLRVEGSLFPIQDLKDYLSDISTNLTKFLSSHYVGRFKMSSEGTVDFIYTDEKSPVRDYPIKDNLNKEGAVEIFEHPVRLSSGAVPRLRYIAGCLLPGEKVMTDIGLMNVEDVTPDRKLINKDGKLVDIKTFFRHHKIQEDVYTLKVSNTFRRTTFTKEHPIYACTPKMNYHNQRTCKKYNLPQRERTFNFEFKEAKDLEVGEYIKVPNVYKKINSNIEHLWLDDCRIDREIPNPLLNLEFWWFLGYWLGDGHSLKHRTVLSINSKEVNYISRICKIAQEIFYRKPSIREREGCVEVSFCNLELSKFLTKHFGRYALGKKIPEWVKYAPPHLKAQLVAGYFAADGSTSIHQRGPRRYIDIVSINLELLEGTQDILFSLGIISNLTRLRKEGTTEFNGYESTTRETYILNLGHEDSLKFRDIIRDTDCPKFLKLKDVPHLLGYNKKRLDCFFEEGEDYIYFKIKGIDKGVYTGWVYNFECSTNTYMCQKITTHNCDPYDDDHSTTNSLGSIFILDRFTDRIVAEYTGRPNTANEFYEVCLRLAKYYNAIINYENDKKGLYGYFFNKNALHYLADNPEILSEKDLVKIHNNYGNKKKGTNSSIMVNAWGRRLQADWLVSNAYGTGGEDEEGNEIPPIMNLQQLRSVGYIKELIAWHPDINADRVSAMGMLMILREDYLRLDTAGTRENRSELTDDPFFKRTGNNFSKYSYTSWN